MGKPIMTAVIIASVQMETLGAPISFALDQMENLHPHCHRQTISGKRHHETFYHLVYR